MSFCSIFLGEGAKKFLAYKFGFCKKTSVTAVDDIPWLSIFQNSLVPSKDWKQRNVLHFYRATGRPAATKFAHTTICESQMANWMGQALLRYVDESGSLFFDQDRPDRQDM